MSSHATAAGDLLWRQFGARTQAQQRLLAAVREQLPTPLQQRLVAAVYNGDTLVLFADSPAATSLLRMHGSRFQGRINGQLFREIQYRNLPQLARHSRLDEHPPPRSKFAARLLQDTIGTDDDAQLAASMARLAASLARD